MTPVVTRKRDLIAAARAAVGAPKTTDPVTETPLPAIDRSRAPARRKQKPAPKKGEKFVPALTPPPADPRDLLLTLSRGKSAELRVYIDGEPESRTVSIATWVFDNRAETWGLERHKAFRIRRTEVVAVAGAIVEGARRLVAEQVLASQQSEAAAGESDPASGGTP